MFSKVIGLVTGSLAVVILISACGSSTDSEETSTSSSPSYSTIISSTTGKVWLDRNLGASRACQSVDDEQCYGDYYQWGRPTDGHEKEGSSTTNTLASTITPNHNKYIIDQSDWTTADSDGRERAETWNPCPTGFRVPTISELEAENIEHINDAFSKLKIPAAGLRIFNGYMSSQGSAAFVWSSNVSSGNGQYFEYDDGVLGFTAIMNTYGHSVRCIQDSIISASSSSVQNSSVSSSSSSSSTVDTTLPTFSTGNVVNVYENNTYVLDINATDETSSVTFAIIQGSDSESFQINASTGVLSFITAPDFETKQNYTVSVSASDEAGNVATQELSVIILDVDEGATFIFDGITYSTLESTVTGRIWLDRNLGASRACTSYDDEQCYGDYYQWGRSSDGHEKISSLTTSTKFESITVNHDKFITAGKDDWTTADSNGIERERQWNPCPNNYHVPTIQELADENIVDQFDAYNKLKLPSSGGRIPSSGTLIGQETQGVIWSRNPYIYSGTILLGQTLSYDNTEAKTTFAGYPASGFSVRCLRDY